MKFQKNNIFNRFGLIVIFFLAGTASYGQSTQSLFWEPEVSIDVTPESPWAYSFSIANRTIFYKKENGETIEDQGQEHIELSHFTSYDAGSNTSVALGVRYRFIETFESNGHDELRFIQQLKYAPENALNLVHRFRLEERLREKFTLRPRYAVAISQPLSEEFGIGFGTETLYSITEGEEPELDQRVSAEISNSSLDNVELSLEIEYQYENYLNSPEGELFILTGISIEL